MRDENGKIKTELVKLGKVSDNTTQRYIFKKKKIIRKVNDSLNGAFNVNDKGAIHKMALGRMVSLGSVGAAILCPVLTLFIHSHYIVEATGMKYLAFGSILAAIVIFNHRANIQRIANGTESKLSFKNKA